MIVMDADVEIGLMHAPDDLLMIKGERKLIARRNGIEFCGMN